MQGRRQLTSIEAVGGTWAGALVGPSVRGTAGGSRYGAAKVEVLGRRACWFETAHRALRSMEKVEEVPSIPCLLGLGHSPCFESALTLRPVGRGSRTPCTARLLPTTTLASVTSLAPRPSRLLNGRWLQSRPVMHASASDSSISSPPSSACRDSSSHRSGVGMDSSDLPS